MDTERLRLKQEFTRQWLEHQLTKAQVAQQLPDPARVPEVPDLHETPRGYPVHRERGQGDHQA